MKATPKVLTGLIPIVPDSGLYLVANGHGDDTRFAGIFRDVWPCLPPPDRRLAEQYWRAHGRRHFPRGPVPRIHLLDGWADLAPGRDQGPRVETKLLAQFRRDGHELLFHAEVVGRMPQREVGGLIRHELAHVVLLAQGDTSQGALREYRADEL